MNVKRGLIRLWIVGCVVWLISCLWFAASLYDLSGRASQFGKSGYAYVQEDGGLQRIPICVPRLFRECKDWVTRLARSSQVLLLSQRGSVMARVQTEPIEDDSEAKVRFVPSDGGAPLTDDGSNSSLYRKILEFERVVQISERLKEASSNKQIPVVVPKAINSEAIEQYTLDIFADIKNTYYNSIVTLLLFFLVILVFPPVSLFIWGWAGLWIARGFRSSG